MPDVKKYNLSGLYFCDGRKSCIRRKRERSRKTSWSEVQEWRRRWTADSVQNALDLLGAGASPEEISKATGIGVLWNEEGQRFAPDLRGFDVTLLPFYKCRFGTFGKQRKPKDILHLNLIQQKLLKISLFRYNGKSY